MLYILEDLNQKFLIPMNISGFDKTIHLRYKRNIKNTV